MSGPHFGTSISIYNKLLRSSGEVDYHKLQDKWRKFYPTSERVQAAVEGIWEAEEEWDQLLRDVDQRHMKIADQGLTTLLALYKTGFYVLGSRNPLEAFNAIFDFQLLFVHSHEASQSLLCLR